MFCSKLKNQLILDSIIFFPRVLLYWAGSLAITFHKCDLEPDRVMYVCVIHQTYPMISVVPINGKLYLITLKRENNPVLEKYLILID